MSRHGCYYGPRPVPCPCGTFNAYWHRVGGLSLYECDDCWRKNPENPSPEPEDNE